MKQSLIQLTLVFSLLTTLSATAEVEIRDTWARATAPGMPMGAVYGVIENTGSEDVTLLSLETDAARLVEIHESVEIDGMMRMREITPFIIPAGGSVALVPGGKHMMLMGLKSALKQGELLELNLKFSDGSDTPVSAVIGGFGQMEMPE